MVYLGIDYGGHKLGLATVTADSGIASPVSVLRYTKNIEEVLLQLAQVITEWAPSTLVFGLPLQEDGSEGKTCKVIRRFAQQLKVYYKDYLKQLAVQGPRELIGLSVRPKLPELAFYPEYFSTRFSNQGLSRKQKQEMGDAYAAAHILEKYVEWEQEKALMLASAGK